MVTNIPSLGDDMVDVSVIYPVILSIFNFLNLFAHTYSFQI